MSLTLAKWTLEHYHRMIDVGLLADRRVELLNGDIVEIGTHQTCYRSPPIPPYR